MKKIFTGTILAFFAIAMLNVTKAETVSSESQLPANCIAYNDGCNNCARWTVDGQWACTLMACVDQTTPTYTCTAFATENDSWNDQIACTMQYDPVCAEVEVQCIQAPCPPIKETFGNACMMNANKNAKFLYKGECKAEETPAPVACTREYMPVCGVSPSQVEQTYGNMCTLKADNAKILYAGECKTGLEAWEWTVYGKVSSVLDKSYLAWEYTPIQAYNYTQTIIDKIDAKLKVSRMKKRAYDKHVQLKRFLETYMKMQNISQ